MVPAVVAAKFSELAFDLRRMRKGRRRAIVAAEVEAVDLIFNDHLAAKGCRAATKSRTCRGAFARSVVNRLHQSHLLSPLPAMLQPPL